MQMHFNESNARCNTYTILWVLFNTTKHFNVMGKVFIANLHILSNKIYGVSVTILNQLPLLEAYIVVWRKYDTVDSLPVRIQMELLHWFSFDGIKSLFRNAFVHKITIEIWKSKRILWKKMNWLLKLKVQIYFNRSPFPRAKKQIYKKN